MEVRRVEDVKWYTPRHGPIIGIVLVSTLHGHKMYIGSAPVYMPETLSIAHIVDTGARFRCYAMWPNIENWYED